ncbi:MAG: 5'-methylthioadenosine phosphorylase [Comamonadaceae bacterium]|nr:5'-methylthioadenosine phosphorylase [Comamonadaceae bacterium]
MVFLARHGYGHTIAAARDQLPRQHLGAEGAAACEGVVSVATVGGMRADLGPGALVVPRPDHRLHAQPQGHVLRGRRGARSRTSTSPLPYAPRLRAAAARRGRRAAASRCVDGGVYACTQGPRLETAAEIERIARDGGDLVGMTGMPEAALAREAGLDYAALGVVVNHAAGRGEQPRSRSSSRNSTA